MRNLNIDFETLINEHDAVIEILNNETDIGCVLISLNYLELCIRYLIIDKFVKEPSKIEIIFDSFGSLSTYKNKLILANNLDLLDKNDFEDMSKLGEIRNLFAHSHKALSFNNEGVVEKCNALNSCKKSLPPFYFNQKELTDEMKYEYSKSKFIHTFINIVNDILASGLLSRILNEKKSLINK